MSIELQYLCSSEFSVIFLGKMNFQKVIAKLPAFWVSVCPKRSHKNLVDQAKQRIRRDFTKEGKQHGMCPM